MVDAKTLQRAIEFASVAHRGQVRKGDGRPYILHPLSVMARLGSVKKSTNAFLLATAAVLHDTVEDCGVELKEIAEKFGFYVAGLVEELTLDKSKYETIGKTKYLCQEMVKMSSYALCIKLCDRLDNVEDMESMDVEWRKKYAMETNIMMNTILSKRKNVTNTHRVLITQIQEVIKPYLM